MCRESAVPQHGSASWTFTEGRLGYQARKEISQSAVGIGASAAQQAGAWHKGDGTLRLDENGNPNYRFNSLLADPSAHVRMMDNAGIDVAVLSCGSGFDQPNLATCRLINDRMHQVEQDQRFWPE
jgi:hypothetical protein